MFTLVLVIIALALLPLALEVAGALLIMAIGAVMMAFKYLALPGYVAYIASEAGALPETYWTVYLVSQVAWVAIVKFKADREENRRLAK